jgi:hypothetical protein
MLGNKISDGVLRDRELVDCRHLFRSSIPPSARVETTPVRGAQIRGRLYRSLDSRLLHIIEQGRQLKRSGLTERRQWSL